MPDPVPSAPIPPVILLRAIRRMARPLVRLLLRNGVTFPVFAELMRGLFIDVAAEDLLTDARSRSDSRISLLTGVHRKEIRRLREAATEVDKIPEIVTLNSAIVARWLADYHEETTAQPLSLPRSAPSGTASFDSLIEGVTTDIRPRAILDDWLNQGIVTIDENDHVRLNTSAFIPRPGGEEQLFFFARNLHDHIAAASENVSARDGAPYLDRTVHYDQLPPAIARRLETTARLVSERALLDINRLALELLESEPEADGNATARFNFGVYVYTEPEPPQV